MTTKDDLERMGIIHIGNTIYPHKFFIPQVGEVHLTPPYRWEDIYEIIYAAGYENGTKHGEKKKISEIKHVLNIK